jgi:hypothetical protein
MVKSMLIILVDIKGIVQKKFVLAGQTINSAYYCDVLWRLRPNFGDKRNGCCIMTPRHFPLPSSPGNR